MIAKTSLTFAIQKKVFVSHVCVIWFSSQHCLHLIPLQTYEALMFHQPAPHNEKCKSNSQANSSFHCDFFRMTFLVIFFKHVCEKSTQCIVKKKILIFCALSKGHSCKNLNQTMTLNFGLFVAEIFPFLSMKKCTMVTHCCCCCILRSNQDQAHEKVLLLVNG